MSVKIFLIRSKCHHLDNSRKIDCYNKISCHSSFLPHLFLKQYLYNNGMADFSNFNDSIKDVFHFNFLYFFFSDSLVHKYDNIFFTYFYCFSLFFLWFVFFHYFVFPLDRQRVLRLVHRTFLTISCEIFNKTSETLEKWCRVIKRTCFTGSFLFIRTSIDKRSELCISSLGKSVP